MNNGKMYVSCVQADRHVVYRTPVAQNKNTSLDCILTVMVLTSSNFFVIKEKALYIAFVEPETVTIRSGHDPSDMLIFAPDYKSQLRERKREKKTKQDQLLDIFAIIF